MYLKLVPEFTIWYGEVFKGLEPERTTHQYLETVDLLKEQVAQTGLNSIQAKSILENLQEQSVIIIYENPFQIANKSGTLEQIKSMMRDRVVTDSAINAFDTFWSEPYLNENGWSQEIGFFNQEIKPLFETNYFRGIAFDGDPIDRFWTIDIWFISLFSLEILARTYSYSRHHRNTSWLRAILQCWYDLFLIIPFSAIRLPLLGILRVIPVAVRLDQARLVNLNPVRNRFRNFLRQHVNEQDQRKVQILAASLFNGLLDKIDTPRFSENFQKRSIFISYRRTDSRGFTRKIYDHLATYFGEKSVFRDLDSIPAGATFKEYIENELDTCQILIAVIGSTWVDVPDKEGNPRLGNPNDWVRLEIEYALKRGIHVIPLLINDTPMPKEQELPGQLKELCARHAARIRDGLRLRTRDVDRLIYDIETLLMKE